MPQAGGKKKQESACISLTDWYNTRMNNNNIDQHDAISPQNADGTQSCNACGDSTGSPQHVYCVPCANDINDWHDSQPEPTDEELDEMAEYYDQEIKEDFGYFGEAGLWD